MDIMHLIAEHSVIVGSQMSDVSKHDQGINHKMSQHMKCWYLVHGRATNAQASLHKCADSPEPSLLAHTMYRCR